MARRRYLSTTISTDTRVNRLAMKSDFAALLYTWMIPHCGDDGSIVADPDEILLIVLPGRRDKTGEDVAAALLLIEAEGLIEWDQDDHCVNYPIPAFYKYQTYITEGRRKLAQEGEEPRNSHKCGDGGANQRKTPQKATSVKSSFNSSLSSPLTPPECENDAIKPDPKPKKSKSMLIDLPDDFEVTAQMRQWAQEKKQLTDAEIDHRTEHFLNYVEKTGKQYASWPAAWRDSMDWIPKIDPKLMNGGIINGHVPRRTGGAAAGGMTPQELDAYAAELERLGQ